MTARYVVGDVFDGLATLESDSVDLVLTSPPFLALRSYLPVGHPDKAREIGSEPTPAAFIDRMLDVVEACSRVLAPHGSLVVELGDTYASSGGVTDHREESLGGNDFAPRSFRGGGRGWPLDKSLCMVPQLFAASLAYGRNLLRPERETEPWRIRNWITWGRPNPPVGALGDKVRPASSWFVVACKGRDRWFDLDAVRTEHVNPRPQQTNGDKNAGRQNGQGHGFTERTVHPVGAPPLDWWDDEPDAHPRRTGGKYRESTQGGGLRLPLSGDRGGSGFETHENGAPPLDWWDDPADVLPGFDAPPQPAPNPRPGTHRRTAKNVESRPNILKTSPDGNRATLPILGETGPAPPLDWWDDEYPSMLVTQATEPYVGAHYATWPETVAKRMIDMMCPRRVCVVCGLPSRRIVGDVEYVDHRTGEPRHHEWQRGELNRVGAVGHNNGGQRIASTVGWSDCGHDRWRRGRVLDPFAGTGTTLAVAEGCGLDSVGIDLDGRNVHLAAQRVGLFLETSTPNAENVAVTGDVL